MNKRTLGAISLILGLAAVGALAVTGADSVPGPRPASQRPTLALLTSLPLVFGESFGLQSGGSPALTRLEQRYNVLPVGVADDASLNGQHLLLMAHPRAQPAEVLVDLDRWVRGGGRLLLLADPRLDWPSELPLGDRMRPPPAFADTGLLLHWGVSLSGPDRTGPAQATVGKLDVMASSPGKLHSSDCRLIGDGFVARCRIGKGRVTIIADADFLNVEVLGAGSSTANLDLVIGELDRLETR